MFMHEDLREKGLSFKDALNSAIRAGARAGSAIPRRRFVQKTFSLGAERDFRWDKALSLAESMEDEELSRKLSLRVPGPEARNIYTRLPGQALWLLQGRSG
jgi:hypothetical protein